MDLGKGEDPDAVRADRVVRWEQWGGLVERGRPSSLRLFKLKPRHQEAGVAADRAEVPVEQACGAPHGWCQGVQGEAAECGPLQCRAPEEKSHRARQGQVGQTHYTKIYDVKTPDGDKIRAKSGTQIVDRFWGFLRNHLKNVNRTPGSAVLSRRIRSAQWAYWRKGVNLWEATGNMLQTLQQ